MAKIEPPKTLAKKSVNRGETLGPAAEADDQLVARCSDLLAFVAVEHGIMFNR